MKNLLKEGYRPKKRPSGHDISTKFQKDNGGSIPPNLIQIANTESNTNYLRECKRKGIKPHPARYPESLAKFFIDFLTDEGDLVIDPFAGSNVTGAVCEAMGRRWVAIELDEKYVEGSMIRFPSDELFDPIDDREPLATTRRKTTGRHRPASMMKKP
jgi:site-specific DNA-methyltransferase (cytosine-N4-specific)